MDEVHGVADVVVHALEGHEQVSVFEASQDAGRQDGGAFNRRTWTGPAGPSGGRTHLVYLLHLVKKSTRQL